MTDHNDLYKEAKDLINKERDVPLLSLTEMEKMYGIPQCLSTGYPSWDLHLVRSGSGSYGFPYGSICEIYGQEGALKSSTLYDLSARNIKAGSYHLDENNAGVSVLAMSETDYSKEYIQSFLKKNGIDEDEEEDVNFDITPVKTIPELDTVVTNLLKPYEEKADEILDNGGYPHAELPRIVIALDSMGKILSGEEKDNMDDDFEDEGRRGLKAKDIHKFFKKHWVTFSKLGVLFIYSNHYRDNMGFGRKKYNPAHNSALKYYASVRCEMSKGYSQKLAKKKSSYKRKYRRGWPLNVKIKKKRDKEVFASEFEIDYYNGVGLDYLGSLMEACEYSGLIKAYSNSYKIMEEGSDFDEEYGDDFPMSKKNFRKKLKNNIEFAMNVENYCYQEGPQDIVEKVVRHGQ